MLNPESERLTAASLENSQEGEAVKCTAVKPLRAQRYDDGGRLKEATEDEKERGLTVTCVDNTNGCIFRMSARTQTCQSNDSRVPGWERSPSTACLKTEDVAAGQAAVVALKKASTCSAANRQLVFNW